MESFVTVRELAIGQTIRLNRAAYVVRAIEGNSKDDQEHGIRTVVTYLTYKPHVGMIEPRSIIVRFSHSEKVIRLA